MKRKRKIKIKKIGDFLEIDTDYGCDDAPYLISELIDKLKEFQEKGGTHIQITGVGYDGGLDWVDIQPVTVEMESEEDYKKRISEEVKRAEKLERAVYEQLKLKYKEDEKKN